MTRFRAIRFTAALALLIIRVHPAGAGERASLPAAAESVAFAIARDTVLELPTLERAVLKMNPKFAAARAATAAAAARAEQAGALDDPMLDLAVAPSSLRSDTGNPAWRVSLTQSIPLFGQYRLKARAANAEGRAASYDQQTVRLDLLLETRDAFFQYQRVWRSRSAVESQLDLMEQFRRVALARYAAGSVGQADPLEAEVELAMLNHESAVLERERRVVLSRLKALLHLPQTASLPPPVATALPEPPSTEEWLSARSDARWPELGAADAWVDEQRAGLTLARRERVPELALNAAYDRFWSESSLRPSVGVSLRLPLNFGRLAAAEREADAGLTAALARRAATRDRLDQRLEEASASLIETRHEAEVLRGQVIPRSERTVQAVRAAYESGRGDFLTLLNTARDLERARLELFDAEMRLEQADAELHRALASDTANQEDRP